MSAEANKAVYIEFLDIVNTGESERLAAIVDPSNFREICIGVTPDWMTLDVARAALAKMRHAIPDLTMTVTDLWCDGEWVIARNHAEGVNSGDFYGAPPSGNLVSFTALDIIRVVDGKLVERSLMPDVATMMRQMGLMPG